MVMLPTFNRSPSDNVGSIPTGGTRLRGFAIQNHNIRIGKLLVV